MEGRKTIFMRFKIADKIDMNEEGKIIYLINDKWDDWFTYETLFQVFYYKDGMKRRIGGVKIGKKHQKERRPELPEEFTELEEDFFSLGENEEYYETLKEYYFREEYLKAMNDIAFNLELFEEVREYDVTRVSLLRDITVSMVKGQFNRIANGGAKLTDYDFTYTLSQKSPITNENVELSFSVECKKVPPTNIHVLIGKNGVGKTTILKHMLMALEIADDKQKYGIFETDWTNDFANVVFVSFSAFDMSLDETDFEEDYPIPYTFVGLVGKKTVKSRSQLAKDFFESFYKIVNGRKHKLWNRMIDVLESDNTFQDLEIKRWTSVGNEEDMKKQIRFENPREQNESIIQYRKRIDRECFKQKIEPQFINLSSGHKVILLTIAKLIDLVEEKTLVLLDEPEEHLHPPLVSAFIRALSDLLIYRNGVGIIATHSPVIVQEVPKKCVWILRRSGNCLINERPQIETFGENLGELTSEIFGYEVANSGFHKILQQVAKQKKSYNDALKYFGNELGKEARAILKMYMLDKETYKGDGDD